MTHYNRDTVRDTGWRCGEQRTEARTPGHPESQTRRLLSKQRSVRVNCSERRAERKARVTRREEFFVNIFGIVTSSIVIQSRSKR